MLRKVLLGAFCFCQLMMTSFATGFEEHYDWELSTERNASEQDDPRFDINLIDAPDEWENLELSMDDAAAARLISPLLDSLSLEEEKFLEDKINECSKGDKKNKARTLEAIEYFTKKLILEQRANLNELSWEKIKHPSSRKNITFCNLTSALGPKVQLALKQYYYDSPSQPHGVDTCLQQSTTLVQAVLKKVKLPNTEDNRLELFRLVQAKVERLLVRTFGEQSDLKWSPMAGCKNAPLTELSTNLTSIIYHWLGCYSLRARWGSKKSDIWTMTKKAFTNTRSFYTNPSLDLIYALSKQERDFLNMAYNEAQEIIHGVDTIHKCDEDDLEACLLKEKKIIARATRQFLSEFKTREILERKSFPSERACSRKARSALQYLYQEKDVPECDSTAEAFLEKLEGQSEDPDFLELLQLIAAGLLDTPEIEPTQKADLNFEPSKKRPRLKQEAQT